MNVSLRRRHETQQKYRHASSDDNGNATSKLRLQSNLDHCSFFRLPPEIRTQVYSLVLTSTYGTLILPSKLYRMDWDYPSAHPPPGLFKVSSVIRQETLPTWYGNQVVPLEPVLLVHHAVDSDRPSKLEVPGRNVRVAKGICIGYFEVCEGSGGGGAVGLMGAFARRVSGFECRDRFEGREGKGEV
jgi:hypothetical protein